MFVYSLFEGVKLNFRQQVEKIVYFKTPLCLFISSNFNIELLKSKTILFMKVFYICPEQRTGPFLVLKIFILILDHSHFWIGNQRIKRFKDSS